MYAEISLAGSKGVGIRVYYRYGEQREQRICLVACVLRERQTDPGGQRDKNRAPEVREL